MKPLKFPGDKDPVQNITQCPDCSGAISEKDPVPYCHNCEKTVDGVKGNPYKGSVPDKGERAPDFGNKDTVLNPGVPLQQNTQNIPFPQKAIPYNRRQKAAESQDHLKRNKKNEDMAEDSKDTVKEVFVSDTVHQCLDPKGKNKKYDDVNKEDVMRSCEDLAIDG
jgi:hypothetical protein